MTGDELCLVDALARLELVTRRLGWSLRVLTDHERLEIVVELAGLCRVVDVERTGLPDETPR